MWKRRMVETFAILTIGDGAIEVISPREHSRLWEAGPEAARKVARFFAENPGYMRALGAAQTGFGIWLALKQYEEV
ncbi:hypothetical protein GBA65_15990 [Rubrobacter marinus]|uniref:Uncharacterized protein n=1 Tax=Rubrobacter marinus TaxID=2653852 RepID=A0A6G8PZZ7_9ACTN|nr:hypothetical protein [Rubrobacter marinus]QIN79782.1 hypothetical protein GBA65_15990 [Rubrobacter marinus]